MEWIVETPAVLIGWVPLAIGAGLAGAGLLGKIIDSASGGPEAPDPYGVERKYFKYGDEGDRLGHIAERWHDPRKYQIDRTNQELREEALGRIRGFEGQAETLQRAGMEQARLQQLALAGAAGPSTKGAALRGAQLASSQAQQGIALGARQRALAEHQAQLQALQGQRGMDIRDELQRQAYTLDKARMAQEYERMREQSRQFGAGLGAQGEALQAQAYGQAGAAKSAAGAQKYAADQAMWGNMMGAGGTMMAAGAMAPSTNTGGGGGMTPQQARAQEAQGWKDWDWTKGAT